MQTVVFMGLSTTLTQPQRCLMATQGLIHGLGHKTDGMGPTFMSCVMPPSSDVSSIDEATQPSMFL